MLLFSISLFGQGTTQFKKVLDSKKTILPKDLYGIPNGGLIIGGKEQNTPNHPLHPTYFKLNDKGEIIWKRTIESDSIGGFDRFFTTIEGGFVGYVNYKINNKNAIAWHKIDENGNIAWSKKMLPDAANDGFWAYNMCETSDKSLISLGYSASNSSVFLHKMNGNGGEVWFNSYFPTMYNYQTQHIQTFSNNQVLIAANLSSETVAEKGTLLLNLDDQDEKFKQKWAKLYASPNTNIAFKLFTPLTDGSDGYWAIGSYNGRHLFSKIDKNGEMKFSKIILPLYDDYVAKGALFLKDKHFFVWGYAHNKVFLMKLNEHLAVIWSKELLAEPSSMDYFTEDKNGNFFASGSAFRTDLNNRQGYDLHITRFDKNGVTNDCTQKDVIISLETVSISSKNIDFKLETAKKGSIKSASVVSNNEAIESKEICKCISTGYIEKILCDNDTYQFARKTYDSTEKDTFLLKNRFNCDSLLIVNVIKKDNISSTQNKTICEGDSVKIGQNTYKTNGKYTFNLKSKDGCDSTFNFILSVKSKSNTSKNISLCDGETYAFQGENISKSGTYKKILQTKEGCDSTLTLNIDFKNNPLIIKDKIQKIRLVEGDSVKIEACSEGKVYEWSNTNYLSCKNCPTPLAYPKKPTQLTLKTTGENGCFTECTFDFNVISQAEAKRGIFYAPNIFSPNGDGFNDFFEIQSKQIEVITLEIYNRWGSLIYKGSGNNAAWDGNFGGTIQNGDIFSYLVQFKIKKTQKIEVASGEFLLMR